MSEIRKKSENRQRQALLACRMLPEEHEFIRAIAARRGLTISAFLRQAAMREVEREP